MKCPDPQLVSVYYDGELPSPWKEKMESHLAKCPRCQHRLDGYSLLSPAKQDESAAHVAAQERVWKKLEEKTGMDSANFGTAPSGYPYTFNRKSNSIRFWGRRISVPLPAAAAAALFIIAAAVLWNVQTRDRKTVPTITVASEEYSLWPTAMDSFDSPGVVPVTDLNEVLQYLSSRDSGDIVILRLPETRSFMSSGEPAIIRAADYTRRSR